MWLTDKTMSQREQVNYLVTLGFDELHHQIEQGVEEPPETWVKFIGELALEMQIADIPRQAA